MSDRTANTIDKGQIEAFVRRVFRDPPRAFVSLCTFGGRDPTDPEQKRRALQNRDIPIAPGATWWSPVVEAAASMAEYAKLAPATATFCPPPCLFASGKGPGTRTERNIAACRVAKVELDKEPDEGERRILAHIGRPSFIVLSGGLYKPEGGQFQLKRHLYFALDRWLSSEPELIELKTVNRILGLIAGAYDPSAISPVHPMRWPGSWNTKAEPVMARITGSDGPAYAFDGLSTRCSELVAELKLDVSGKKTRTVLVDGRATEVETTNLAAAVSGILDGSDYHHALNTVLMTTLKRSLLPEEAQSLAETLMDFSHGRSTRPLDWEERRADIARAAGDAYAKLSFGATDSELVEEAARAAEEAVEEAAAVPAAIPAPIAASAPAASPAPAKLHLFTILTGNLQQLLPPRPWLVRELLLRGSVFILAAAPGVGKTIWALQLAAGLASGKLGALIGDYDAKPGLRTLVINNEEPTEELRRRLHAVVAHFELAPAELDGRIVLWGSDTRRFVAGRKRSRDSAVEKAAAADGVVDIMRKLAIDLVIIDPMISTHEGLEENSNADMEKLATIYRDIAHQTNAAVLIVQHTRKSTTGGKEGLAGDTDVIRGAGAIGGAIRGAITLSRPVATAKAAEAMGLSKAGMEAAALALVRMDAGKANYAKRRRAGWYVFETVNLINGTATDNWEGDEVGVLVPVSRAEIVKRFAADDFPDDTAADPAANEREGVFG